MKVQVSKTYTGVFGQFDEACQTVRAKKAGDPPFIVPDEIAAKKIKEGVLMRVDDPDDAPLFAPELPEAEEPAPTADAPVIEAETAVKEEPARKVAQKRRKTTRK